jgi:glycopeptide antibiotics resistance protein
MFTDVAIEILKNNWPMLFIFITIMVSLRIAYLFNNKKPFIFYQEIIGLTFIIYILSLFYLVTFQDVTWSSSNFIPFKEILRYELWSPKFIRNVIGNIIVFIPYGFYASYIVRINKAYIIFILGLITSLSIEFTQLMIGRVFDIDDIMMNIVGVLFGYLIYVLLKILKNKLPSIFQKNWFYNIIVLIILVILALYLASYLKVGLL